MRSTTGKSSDKALDRRSQFLALRRKHITQPSAVEGLARIFDIAGTMQDRPLKMHVGSYSMKSSSESRGLNDDAKKLTSDWYTVVDDLDRATKKFLDS